MQSEELQEADRQNMVHLLKGRFDPFTGAGVVVNDLGASLT
jgi:hypothetical protein